MDMRPMELRDTVELMNSADYKERFLAEYLQLRIRHGKLEYMLERHDEGTLNFVPTCPIELLKAQEKAMASYLHMLQLRAEYEGIKLTDKLK